MIIFPILKAVSDKALLLEALQEWSPNFSPFADEPSANSDNATAHDSDGDSLYKSACESEYEFVDEFEDKSAAQPEEKPADEPRDLSLDDKAAEAEAEPMTVKLGAADVLKLVWPQAFISGSVNAQVDDICNKLQALIERFQLPINVSRLNTMEREMKNYGEGNEELWRGK